MVSCLTLHEQLFWIQQEIDGKGPSKDEATGRTRSSKASKSTTDGTHGAVTGIALGEYANKKGGSGTVHIKMKGGKAEIRWNFYCFVCL